MIKPVNRDGMQSMLQEMQAMRTGVSQPIQKVKESNTSAFGDMLKEAIVSANQNQVSAENLQTRHELGDKDADLVSVMLATQKANISFQTLMQVRNRMLNAYRDVINMPM